mgnify:FL=1|jgi:hypothetical protein|tara:strand:+ start:3431 stop:4135 length:705 start_codon:yes stop_codon:yes gene_type:complete
MPRKRRKKSRNYFTQDTEDAIVLYNNTSDPEIRSKIYEARIHYAFFKLTENIIHTFKFYHTEVDNLEHLQHEIITFLLSKIHLFDPTKGAKAYSYFGTIVKRWLILYNTKNYNKKIKKVEVDILTKDGSHHAYDMDSGKLQDDLNKYINLFVEYTSENIYELFPKKNDAQIADAILELFRKRETIEVFNKKALYIYIREMVDVKTPKITKIADKLHAIFKSQYVFYLENGWAKF